MFITIKHDAPHNREFWEILKKKWQPYRSKLFQNIESKKIKPNLGSNLSDINN